MTEDVISLQGVSRHYQMGGETIRALDGIDLSVRKNEYVAVIGASGSGKSTMMNILGCLDRPTGGIYRLGGVLVNELSDTALSMVRNKDIGFVFQSFNLLPRSNALQNVMRPLIYAGVPRKERIARAMTVLERVGLKGREYHLPRQLSGGQSQRVAIARALVTNPAIILADEPTGNLDSVTTAEIMALFDQLVDRGHTIIIVTHEPDIAERCYRVVTISDGRVLDDRMTARRAGQGAG